MKCQDCYEDFDSLAKWDKNGLPLNVGCFVKICATCMLIRKKTHFCLFCGIKLEENGVEFCQSCCNKVIQLLDSDFVFLCPVCNSILKQDPENMKEMWCPKCLEKRGEFIDE